MPSDTRLQYIDADELHWLSGTSMEERRMCTAHRTTRIDTDPSASTWDQQAKEEGKCVRGCNFLSGHGMKYFSLVDPCLTGSANDAERNNGLAYRSELEMRQKLGQAAADLRDIVNAVDDDYGISEALASGTTPTIPRSVSSIHYTIYTKYNETRNDIEWYSLRDACQWLTHWSGVCESVLANIVDMICKTGPETAATWHSYLWNKMLKCLWLQYLKKAGAEIAKSTPQASKSDILKLCQSKGTVMLTIKTRTLSGDFEGGLAAILATQGIARDDVCDCAIHDAAMGQAMAFDISKDQQGIISIDVTNTLAENLGNTEADSRRLVIRQMLHALAQTSAIDPRAAEVCAMFLYSAPLYTRFLERYRQRNMSTRVAPSATMRHLVDHIGVMRRRDILA
ncbi:hypothetical protein BGX26_000870 [Mortierella sp. AD094]|nr:hypothetical protein BGX26_000870 [Mortierella sp. AD094]